MKLKTWLYLCKERDLIKSLPLGKLAKFWFHLLHLFPNQSKICWVQSKQTTFSAEYRDERLKREREDFCHLSPRVGSAARAGNGMGRQTEWDVRCAERVTRKAKAHIAIVISIIYAVVMMVCRKLQSVRLPALWLRVMGERGEEKTRTSDPI
jgi:hypothetical protein